MMAKPTSPTRFSGEADHFYDANFTAEISQKMRIPKRIRVDGESDDVIVPNGSSNWIPAEKLEMKVPERIVVLDEHINGLFDGADDHYDTRSIPKEYELENNVMSPEPGHIRVQTPPRVITLDRHYYPSADEYPSPPYTEPVRNNRHLDDPDRRLDLSISMRDQTPIIEALSTNDEVIHLRKQLAKLNRRVMSIELENMQRQQREKIVYGLGLAYLFIKTLLWLSRSN